jgi:hypothetical protein
MSWPPRSSSKGTEMGTTAAAGTVRLSHLLPCSNCAAENGLTARVCWSCEALLVHSTPRPSDFELQQPAVAEPAVAEPVAESTAPAAALDPQLGPQDEPQLQPQPELQRRADPEPSFFPILHDEATDFQTAANDHPESELALQFMQRRNASRRLATGAVCVASVVMVLGTYLIVRSMSGNEEAALPAFASSTAPAPEATLVPTAYAAPPAVQPTIEPAAAESLPKIAAPRRDDALTAHASPEPAAAEPVKAKRRAVAPAAVEAPAPSEPVSCAPQVVALGLCDASSR